MGCFESRGEPVPLEKPIQVAGHPGAIKFDGQKLHKKCGEAEISNYEAIFADPTAFKYTKEQRALQQMRHFVPKYYGSYEENGEKKIMIENMLHEAPNASFIDIKLGTSTVTLNTLKKGAEEIARRELKDSKTTSAELGYTICGFCQKDGQTGQVIESEFKMFPP